MIHHPKCRIAALPCIAIAAFFLVMVLGLSPHSFAQTLSTGTQGGAPSTLSYQGIINNGTAPIADGIHHITISLYTDESGSNSIWSSTYSPQVTGGVFNVLIGSDKPLPEPALMDRPLWVGIRVDGGSEMRPLTQLSASAYAMNVADNSITTSKLAKGAVTSEKLNLGYVSAVTVDGQPITNTGDTLNLVSTDGLKFYYDASTKQLSAAVPVRPVVLSGGLSTPNPCGSNTDDLVGTNTVAGGCSNNTLAPGGYATISGGESNKANGTWSTVSGGDTNIASGDESTIGGGTFNLAIGTKSFIGGGEQNAITNASAASTTADASTITAGSQNTIDRAFVSGIVAGDHNQIDNNGLDDTVGDNIIGAGEGNVISSDATNPPGYTPTFNKNMFTTRYAGILAGAYNHNHSYLGMIGAGWSNTLLGGTQLGGAHSASSFVGAGQQNLVDGFSSAIVGGITNTIGNISVSHSDTITSITPSDLSIIGGGEINLIQSNLATIGGGFSNSMGVHSDTGFIGGGAHNNILLSKAATIGGGSANQIGCFSAEGGDFAFIGGGQGNQLKGNDAVIAGGGSNTILCTADFSAIGGGHKNFISSTTTFATIAGGDTNTIDFLSDHSAIGGGQNNLVTASATHATIPGGDSLTAQSFAQTVIGYNNKPQGSFVEGMPNDFPSNMSNANDFLFIAGNGNSGTQSDAFDVSYDGHSIVHDDDGNAMFNATRPSMTGGTFVDNVTYAWGDIQGFPTPPGPPLGNVVIASSFGVASVTYINAGDYRVKLNVTLPDGTTPVNLTHGFSVTATNVAVLAGVICRNITVTPINTATNSFDIFIQDPQTSCQQVDGRVMFEVHGRP